MYIELLVTGLACFILGFKMGQAVGINDGLRRAQQLMDEVYKCVK